MNALFLPEGFRATASADAPLISIVTASFNSAKTLRATLESVAMQKARNFEHIVVDGASSDATLEIAGDYDVRVVSEPDGGIYEAFNKGLGLARGELIAFLNSDDVYAHDGVTALIEEAAGQYPEADVFHGDLDFVDAVGVPLDRWRFKRRSTSSDPYDLSDYLGMKNRPQLWQPASFVRRRLFARLGGFDTQYRIAADYDFFQRAFCAGVRIRHVPSLLVAMRDGGLHRQQRLKTEFEVLHSTLRMAGAAPLKLTAATIDFARFHSGRYLRNRLRGLMTRLRRRRPGVDGGSAEAP